MQPRRCESSPPPSTRRCSTAMWCAAYLLDATEARGVRGRADAVVLARTAKDVARVLAWCYAHDVALAPRGAAPATRAARFPDGGVVVAIAGLRSVRSIEPCCRGREFEGGVPTREVQRLRARTGSTTRPIPARPSSRRSAATSRPTPAAHTRSGTASPARG